MSSRPARRPVGTITRGTTNPNRLRRIDRWMAWALRATLRAPVTPPIVVDLGYGASPVTVLELADRLARVRPDVRLVGIEIDPDRVQRALPWADPPRITFARGGFEIPLPDGQRPTIIRAFNVLRQYEEAQVGQAWSQLVSRLAPGGVLVEGTCDELGRLACWVDIPASSSIPASSPSAAGSASSPSPRSLTFSWRLARLERPSVIAERLPKVLIHRNVPGEPIHHFLTELDAAWARQAPLASYGARQRFLATATELAAAGWPVRGGRQRWRLGELGVDWAAIAPLP